MEFGHSEGTFTLKIFLVYLVKLPSELQNCQNLTRQSRFVVYVAHANEKLKLMEFGHSEGTFTIKKILVYLVKVPSELQNSQRGARESSFVVGSKHPLFEAAGESNRNSN